MHRYFAQPSVLSPSPSTHAPIHPLTFTITFALSHRHVSTTLDPSSFQPSVPSPSLSTHACFYSLTLTTTPSLNLIIPVSFHPQSPQPSVPSPSHSSHACLHLLAFTITPSLTNPSCPSQTSPSTLSTALGSIPKPLIPCLH
jgi:hypothetical protein